MKFIKFVLIVCLLLIGLASEAYAIDYMQIPSSGGFASGNGTKNDPYLISNAGELAFFRNQVNQGNTYENQYVKLAQNIRINEGQDLSYVWAPIIKFAGDFDGAGYTISGIYIPNQSKYSQAENASDNVFSLGWGSGLFAVVGNTAVIHDVVVSGLIETPQYNGECGSAGGIAAECAGEIYRCVSYITFAHNSNWLSHMNGISGCYSGAIADCIDNSTYFDMMNQNDTLQVYNTVYNRGKQINCVNNGTLKSGEPTEWNVYEP